MKVLQIIDTVASILLLIVVLIFGFYFMALGHLGPVNQELPSQAPVGAESSRGNPLPQNAKVKGRLVVLRGLKVGLQFPLYEGENYLGRADEKPVDIDLEDQEPRDRIWSSRQHALITCENGSIVIEDLNSSNGTFVNRTRVFPGQKRTLKANDVIQIGTVQLKYTEL